MHEDFDFTGVGLREVRIVNQESFFIEGSNTQSNCAGSVGESSALR
jgi:hypothetical protein